MNNLFETLKSFFKYHPKQIMKRFFGLELDDLNREKLMKLEELRLLDARINKVELMLFGN